MSTATATGAKIEIRGLTKRFGSFVAVDDLSFDVEPGRITGFLGPNGAGKTTTLRMLLGLVHSTSGTATINGQRYVDLPAPQSTVGAALEATNFHPGRSGRDHLRVLADAGSIPHTRVDELLELTGIPAAARKRAGEYSMGMRQRLGLAAALLGDPQVLVLDEPSNGLDPEGIRWLRGFLRHLSHEGKTILVSSHLLQEVEQTVDEVVIIANGRLVRAGAMSELHGTPGAVIRTSDRERLAGALRVADVTSAPGDDDTLVADTTDLRLVGDVALRAGLPIYGLEPKRADLEALFFELTEGTNRNESARGRAPRGGCRDRPGRSEPVTAAIRSEFRKFFTTRMWWGMAIAIFVAGGAFAALFAFVVHQGTTGGPGSTPIIGDDTQVANTVYTSGISVGYLLMLTIGVMSIGSEYRHKTISATFLATPRRTRAMVAKVFALIGIGAVYGLISLVGSVAVGSVGLTLIDRPRLPLLAGRPLAGPQPARAGALGADRPGHRHPHPEPGGGAAHRHRRGLDRRAAPRARAGRLGVRARAHRRVPAVAGDQRRGQRHLTEC